ncbi:alpha/beta hydrolase [Solibacillus sp. MA9]|uniref:Alpha/beta hydrolase n=1 Tax=Solibacillus palustris TaxID=2908203 RepID=A0ABS9UB53_9BACL|nr:alpha/beta hydrolase [Solibacillus sp. MA9]MCH7321544.1 alpha/beta hydrolase [Solibacillus sp. MA9]
MIYFDEYGDRNNPTILLLHGAAAVDTFTQQYQVLNNYHLIVPHLYGAGESVKITYNPHKLKQEILELVKSLNKPSVGIMGHSIGAQLAVMLVTDNPELFSRAVFLSAWVCPNEKSIRMYCKSAPVMVKLLRYKWIVKLQAKYWNYTKKQSDYMADYARKLTVENYQAFFNETMNIKDFPGIFEVTLPMLAICGQRESKDIKNSLELLAQNASCQTMILPKAGHDFPMRCASGLNPILNSFYDETIN